MSSRRFTSCDGLLAAATLTLLLALSHPLAALAVKGLVDPFALGHSASKTLALLLFLILILTAARTGKLPTPPRGTYAAYALVLGVLSILSVGEFFWFCQTYSVSPWDWSAAARDGFWSSSNAFHIHTSKMILAPLFGGLSDVTDAGYPFEPFFSPLLIYGHLALFLLLLALTAAGCLRAFRERPLGEALSLTLALYALSKNMVDGGPLNSEVRTALLFFLALCWGRKAMAAGAVFFLIGAVWQLQYPLSGSPANMIWKLLLNALALGLPILWPVGRPRWAAARRAAVVLLGAGVYFAPLVRWHHDVLFRFQPFAWNSIMYGKHALQTGQQVWILTREPGPVERPGLLEVVQREPAGGFTLLTVRLLRASDPMELCRTYGLPLGRLPVSWRRGRDRVFQIEARDLIGPLKNVVHSPLVRSVQTWRKGPFTVYQMHLPPHVDDNAAIALLGPQLTILTNRYAFFPESPRPR